MEYEILHVVPRFFPHVGGLENIVFDLTKEQAKKQEVSVLTLDSNFGKEKNEEKDGVRIYRSPSFQIPGTTYQWPKRGFCEWFAKQEFDVVLTHTRFFVTNFLAGRVAKKQGKKWIHVEHGANFFQAKNIFIRILARGFDETFGKWVLRNADKVVVLTEEGRRFVARLGRTENVFIIPNGAHFPSEEKKLPHQNKAIFVGRATAEKGIYELLRAAEKCSEWQFIVVGENPRKLRNTANVHFCGELSRDETRQKIIESSLLISPSWGEGFGLSLLEAASLARPILSTSVGIAPEILSSEFIISMKNGHPWAGNSQAVLAKKIQALTNDFAKMEEVGRGNFERAKTFSLEKMARRYEEVMDRNEIEKL